MKYIDAVRTKDPLQNELRQLIEKGLTFGECIAAFAAPKDDPIVLAAREITIHQEGKLEVDETTVRSGSTDDGDYVLAWLWVSNEEAGLPSLDDEDNDK